LSVFIILYVVSCSVFTSFFFDTRQCLCGVRTSKVLSRQVIYFTQYNTATADDDINLTERNGQVIHYFCRISTMEKRVSFRQERKRLTFESSRYTIAGMNLKKPMLPNYLILPVRTQVLGICLCSLPQYLPKTAPRLGQLSY
jgi:hypothetical protein